MAELVFDSQIDPEFREKMGQTSPDGSTTYRREKKEHTKRVYNEERVKALAENYTEVCIHDYGDDYHLSDEERAQRNKFYKAFHQLMRCKRKFHKLPDYIKVFRIAMECLRLVAESNQVYDPDEFCRLVMEGELYVDGLVFPKYIGKDKKHINWEYVITEFVMNPDRDLSELTTTKDTEYLDISDQEAFQLMFTEAERQMYQNTIAAMREEDEGVTAPAIYGRIPGDLDTMSEKKVKRLLKEHPVLLRDIRSLEKERKKLQSLRLNDRFAFTATEDDYEEIERLDRARGIQSGSDLPKFTGSLFSDKDFNEYMREIEMYERATEKINYKGKMKTRDEIAEIELLDQLERDGWNLRKFKIITSKEKKLEKAYKENKKKEEAIKQRLLSIQDGNSGKKPSRDRDGLEFNSKKRKKGKKSKKKKEDD